MALSVPKFIKTAFSSIGLRNNIPESTNNTTGAAGYDRGFGEINMLPEGAGGIPPDGKDFNGIFYDISSAIQYLQSGVDFPFNQEYASAIGGYEIGAIVSDSSNKSLLWINETVSNTAFPAGWAQFSLKKSSETIQGTIRVGTQSEVNAGAIDSVVVTPKKLRFGFSVSFLQDGYIAFPTWLGGFILQWGGTSAISSGGSVPVTFPIAFPESCLHVFLSQVSGAALTSVAQAATNAPTKTSVQIWAYSGGGTSTWRWFAFGY